MSRVPDVGELYGLSAQVVDRFMRQTGEIFAAHQVPYAQARTLLQLGDERTAVHMKTLAEAMGVVPRSITSVVDGLERRGLVRRTPDPDDRRAMLISLTAQGTELVERIHQANIELGGELFAQLSAQELATFGELLRAILKDTPAQPEGLLARASSSDALRSGRTAPALCARVSSADAAVCIEWCQRSNSAEC